MSILNSYDMEDLTVSSHMTVLLKKLGIDDAERAFQELCYELEYEFADCCHSRLRYCECSRVRSMRPG